MLLCRKILIQLLKNARQVSLRIEQKRLESCKALHVPGDEQHFIKYKNQYVKKTRRKG